MKRIFEGERVIVELDHRRSLRHTKALTPAEAAMAFDVSDHQEAVAWGRRLDQKLVDLLADRPVSLEEFAHSGNASDLQRYEDRCLRIFMRDHWSTPFGQAAFAVVAASRPTDLAGDAIDEGLLPKAWTSVPARQVLLNFDPGRSGFELLWGTDVIGKCHYRLAPVGFGPQGVHVHREMRWLLPATNPPCGHVTYVTAPDGAMRFGDINSYLAQCAGEQLLLNQMSPVAESWWHDLLTYPHTRAALEALRRREGDDVLSRMLGLTIEWTSKEVDPKRIDRHVIDELLKDMSQGRPDRHGKITEVSLDELLAEYEFVDSRRDAFPNIESAIDLREAMARLTPRQRTITELLVAGKTQFEIAASIGISQPAVSQQLSAIRTTLKELLGN